MTTHDTPEAALAAALLAFDKASHDPEHGPYPHACDSPEYWLDDAAAILAALPPDWCGHDTAWDHDEVLRIVFDQQAEIARLRAALERADHLILGSRTPPDDHACAECVPGGPIVVPGFRCVFHEAEARAALAPAPSEP